MLLSIIDKIIILVSLRSRWNFVCNFKYFVLVEYLIGEVKLFKKWVVMYIVFIIFI